ncbi:MAG: sporulation protein YabP [Clostridia bacterium]|nr:sporulation protein YabP [Clostridia bacterium]
MEETRQPHQVILKNREKAVISGAAEVDSFDENRVVLVTNLGVLVIKGRGMHIQALNVESGDVSVSGQLDGIEYIEAEPKTETIWGKLFK